MSRTTVYNIKRTYKKPLTTKRPVGSDQNFEDISKNDMSEPFFRRTASPQSKCVQKRLIPLLKIKHSDDNYVF
jgi:hypothetical protein